MKQITLIPINQVLSTLRDGRTDLLYTALEDLTASIKQHGVLQPIIVNKQGENFYIISGMRRLKAAEAAGLTEIPASVMQISDEDVEIIRLHENLFREDLSALDQAQSLLYLEQHFHLTREKIATLMGRTKGWVTQRIDVLSWSIEIKMALSSGTISYSIGRELAKVDDVTEQKRLLALAVESGATVRIISTWVTEWQQKQQQKSEQITSEDREDILKEIAAIHIAPCYTCGDDKAQEIHLIGVCTDCLYQLKLLGAGPEEKKPDAAADKVT
jgi:ParB family chromosome partitioning protein